MTKRISELTWEDLDDGFESRVLDRGKTYFQEGAVEELYRTAEQEIIAKIRGSETYFTLVRIDDEEDEIESLCSCPYHYGCKHGVAALLQYAADLKKGIEVPSMSSKDEKLKRWMHAIEDADDFDETDEFDQGADEDSGVPMDENAKAIAAKLDGFSKEELVVILTDMIERFPMVESYIDRKIQLKQRDKKPLVQSVYSIFDALESDDFDGYYTNFEDQAQLLLDSLKALQAIEAYDELLELASDLLDACSSAVQYEQESESHPIFKECIEIVMDALKHASPSTQKRILLGIDLALADDFGFCEKITPKWLKRLGTVGDWDEVANELLKRLISLKFENDKEQTWGEQCRRNDLSEWIVHSLDYSGRSEEIHGFYRTEAELTGKYGPFIKYLMDEKAWAEAEHYCLEAIKLEHRKEAIKRFYISGIQGIQGNLIEIYENLGRKMEVAAILSQQFFENPSSQKYSIVLKYTKALSEDFEDAIRWFLLHFLETGHLPRNVAKDAAAPHRWPFPLDDSSTSKSDPSKNMQFPAYETLIEIGILEKNASDVLKWYKVFASEKPRHYSPHTLNEVALCLRKDYPDWSVAIWKRLAEENIKRGKPSGYQDAAPFLKKVRKTLLEEGQHADWEMYYEQLCDENRRRPRCMEVLRKFEKLDRPITGD